MAIVRYESGASGIERHRAGKPAKHVAKKHAEKKQPAKKHAAKHAAKHAEKHAAKHAEKHAARHAEKHTSRKPDSDALRRDALPASEGRETERAGEDLEKAFHHLQRAGAVISLMGRTSASDLLQLHELGISLYLAAAAPKAKKHQARAAQGVLRATEHLALAALYSARLDLLVKVPVPAFSPARQMEKLYKRLIHIQTGGAAQMKELSAAARELLNRADAAERDPHLQHELIKAVDGLCTALEEGV